MSANSVQSDVLDAVVAALNAAGNKAFRCRFSPFAVTELPADNVLPDDEAADYQDNDDLEIRHKLFVRHTGAAVDQVDKAIDARYVAGQKAILADLTLGGLVRITRYVSRKWEFEKGEYDTVALVVTYEVEFSTSRRDPSVAGF